MDLDGHTVGLKADSSGADSTGGGGGGGGHGAATLDNSDLGTLFFSLFGEAGIGNQDGAAGGNEEIAIFAGKAAKIANVEGGSGQKGGKALFSHLSAKELDAI